MQTPTQTPTADADSDSDSDTDAHCTDIDLVWTAEVHDASGHAGTSFTAADELSVVGVATNPCANAIDFTTSTGCMVAHGTFTAVHGATGTVFAPDCTMVITTWTVAAGHSISEANSIGSGWAADDYTATVFFNWGGETAHTTVTVTH